MVTHLIAIKKAAKFEILEPKYICPPGQRGLDATSANKFRPTSEDHRRPPVTTAPFITCRAVLPDEVIGGGLEFEPVLKCLDSCEECHTMCKFRLATLPPLNTT